jgi:hypothetical protein
MNSIMDYPLVVFGLSLVVMWISARAGTRIRRKRQGLNDAEHEDLAASKGRHLRCLRS